MKAHSKNSIEHDLRTLRTQLTAFHETAKRILHRLDVQASAEGYSNPSKILLIQEIVAAYFELPLSVMTSKVRTASFVQTRQIAMYLCRDLTNYSSTAIGDSFARDHGTVLHACVVIANEIPENKKLAEQVAHLRAQAELQIKNIETPLFAAIA